jgi:hypothetical protein
MNGGLHRHVLKWSYRQTGLTQTERQLGSNSDTEIKFLPYEVFDVVVEFVAVIIL